MSILTSRTPAGSYKDLLQVSNSNSGVDATLRAIEDGEGTVSAISISTTAVSIAGNIAVTGTVDGRDVATDGTTLDAISNTGVSALTSAEVDQLENIDTVTITNTQWGYLGSMDQALSTSDDISFNTISVSGIKSGAAQGAAGASAGEVWKTSGHATLPDNVLLIGV